MKEDWTGNKSLGSVKPRKSGTKSGTPKKAGSSSGKKPSGKSAAKQY